MIITWIHLFLIALLVREDNAYLTGFVGQQTRQLSYVINDLTICTKDQVPSSVSHVYKTKFYCVRKCMLHCILRNNSTFERQNGLLDPPSSRQRYCGSLFLNKHDGISTDMVLFIQIRKGHILYHEVIKFNFKITRGIYCRDHGLVFSYKGYKNQTYCGKRVPWTMIIPSDKSYVRLAIKSYIHYDLSIFYSSAHVTWMIGLLRVQLLKPPNIGVIFTGHNTQSLLYYLFTEQGKFLSFNVTVGPLNGSVILHDGPGRLSRVMYKFENTNSTINIKRRASAFWSFIEMIIPYKYGTVMEIRVTVNNSAHKTPNCFNQNWIYIPASSAYNGNVICAGLVKVNLNYPAPHKFLSLHVKQFVFNGPNKLTDSSSSLCEYGGLNVKFNARDKGVDICENIRDTNIHSSNNKLYVNIVWFYGYSHGNILAKVFTSQCGTHHLGLYPDKKIHQLDFTFHFNPTPDCYFVVCPPVQTDRQRSCIIQFGPPSVGTTLLEITTRNTIEHSHACVTDDNATNGSIAYTLSAMYTENWPFGLNNGTIMSQEKHNTPNTHKYEFLHFATVNLSLLCNTKLLLGQISILVKISECQKLNNKYHNYVANGIPALSDKCIAHPFIIAIKGDNKTTTNNYQDYIHKGTGHITTGHDVHVEYKSCPVKCRNIRYTVFVRSRDRTTILEYSSQAGYAIFTGYYDIGFRVIIETTENDCTKQECILTLSVRKKGTPIGTPNYIPPGSWGAFQLYERR